MVVGKLLGELKEIQFRALRGDCVTALCPPAEDIYVGQRETQRLAPPSCLQLQYGMDQRHV